MVYFTLVIFNATSFFLVKMGCCWTFILEFKPLPANKTLACYIPLDSKIMNIKLSFVKNNMANFDYALTLKKKLGYKLFTIC